MERIVEGKEKLRLQGFQGTLHMKAHGKHTENKWYISDRKAGVDFLHYEKLMPKKSVKKR